MLDPYYKYDDILSDLDILDLILTCVLVATVIMTEADDTHTLALQVLKAISKSVASAVQLDFVPEELCYGDDVDLSRWTMIVNDDTLKLISEQPEEHYHVNCKEGSVPRMFDTFWVKKKAPTGLMSLNIANSKEITDFGMACIARNSPNLRYLNISGCVKVGDASLRDVALNCIKLQSLIMTACFGIDGSGLAAIAESCHVLSKINVKGCKALQRWALAKVFFKCSRLEDVDISEIREVGDNEIRVLSESCPNLSTFIAKECPFISDQSLLVLSQHCPDLDTIDVSRTFMTFRITDVGLLALGSRTFSLRVLKLNGCEQITDVGLTWLAEGCKILEVLDIKGCNKITDAGLRSIGVGCHNLNSLDICGARYVSDIGLACIANGCPQLKHLWVHELYLLADPKLGAPKKAEKAQAWEAVVGTAALAKFSPLIETIDLSGCFRLNIAIKSHIARMSKLKVVNLAGCNQVAEDAMLSLCKHCPRMEEINFTDCGKAINGTVITALANNCKNIRILTLNRLDNIKGGAVKAISTCEHLKRLELSGCRGLTDHMLLPICEVDRVVGLSILSLSNNPQLTDTTMAWVAYGRQQLLTLSLRGTSISKQAITSVRDRFPFSEVTHTDKFYGFLPKTRVEDRQLMNEYNKVSTGFIKLQARARGMRSHRLVSSMLERRRYLKAILMIQLVVKRFYSKMQAYRLRMERERLHDAAVRVTSIMWIAVALGRVKRRKKFLYEQMLNKMAIIIQRRYRHYFVVMTRWRAQMEYEEFVRRQHFGATKMQSIVRMVFAKRRVGLIKKMREARHNVQVRKAFLIQRVFRGHLGRVKLRQKRAEYHLRVTLKILSATKVQFNYRRHRTVSIINHMVENKQSRMRSVLKIQSAIRGALARLLVGEIRLEMREQLLDWAVRKIQGCWFVKAANLEVKRLLAAKALEEKRRNYATIVIQLSARCRQARKVVNQAREEHIMSLKLQIETEMWAIIKIQSFYRGCKGRNRFELLLREKKGKWKELYDETKQKRFFYNQLTGEIRWRMPQDLLDLIPRPLCDNCQYYEAQVECALCNEMFCAPCWDQVHRGGRRRDHEFRSIYDYYGKRIDYGDGIFPCKWPTEVMQDEVQGWMLRVAPIRDPVAVYEDWEEYVDENNDSISRPTVGEGVTADVIPIAISGGVERDGKFKALPRVGSPGQTSPGMPMLGNASNQFSITGGSMPVLGETVGGGGYGATMDGTVAPDDTSAPEHKPRTFYFNRVTFEAKYEPPEVVQAIRKQQDELAEYEERVRSAGTASSGGWDQTYATDYDGNQGYYDANGVFTPAYQAPGSAAGYTAPGTAYDYQAPGSAAGYTAPGTAYDYQAPGSAAGYPAPGTAYGFNPPGSAFGYMPPGSAAGYTAPGTAAGYTAPGTAYDYQAPGSAAGYTAPGTATGYTAPGTAYDYQAPGSPGYNAPGTAYDYQAPGSPGYNAPGTAYDYQAPGSPGYNAPGTAYNNQAPGSAHGYGDYQPPGSAFVGGYTAPGTAAGYTAPSTAYSGEQQDAGMWNEYNPTPYNYQPPSSSSGAGSNSGRDTDRHTQAQMQVAEPYNSGPSEGGYYADAEGNPYTSGESDQQQQQYYDQQGAYMSGTWGANPNASFTVASTQPNFTSPVNKGKMEAYQAQRKAAAAARHAESQAAATQAPVESASSGSAKAAGGSTRSRSPGKGKSSRSKSPGKSVRSKA